MAFPSAPAPTCCSDPHSGLMRPGVFPLLATQALNEHQPCAKCGPRAGAQRTRGKVLGCKGWASGRDTVSELSLRVQAAGGLWESPELTGPSPGLDSGGRTLDSRALGSPQFMVGTQNREKGGRPECQSRNSVWDWQGPMIREGPAAGMASKPDLGSRVRAGGEVRGLGSLHRLPRHFVCRP